MSKQSSLLCVVCCVLVVVLLLAGDHWLAVPVAAAAQIGDEFLCQDPILMLSHAASDELNGAIAAAPAFAREEEEGVFVDEGQAFSTDEYVGDGEEEEEDEEALFVGAPDPGRSADEEELVDDEEKSLLSGQDAVAEGSNNSEEHVSIAAADVECPECGKRFRSDKSMFGHLKSHPDRGYKGAMPPPAKPKLLLSSTLERPVARHSNRDPNLNAFEILAAYVMLTLKHRRDDPAPQDRSVSVKTEPADAPPEEEVEGSVVSRAGSDVVIDNENGGSVAKKNAIGEDDTVRRSEHGSSSVADTAGDGEVRRSSEHGSSAAEMTGDDHPALRTQEGSAVVAKRGRTKKSKEAAQRKEKDVAKGRRPYVCKHCQAVFPTHQALGGHMAAHNKDRRVQAQNDQAAWEAHHQGQSSLDRQEPKISSEEPPQRGGLSAAARELLMERYTRLFNTGWQSRQEETGGGYKRQHTGSEDGGGAMPMAAAPRVGDGDRRRLFGVDLNAWAPGHE